MSFTPTQDIFFFGSVCKCLVGLGHHEGQTAWPQWKISVKYLSRGHSSEMPDCNNKPATFRLPASAFPTELRRCWRPSLKQGKHGEKSRLLSKKILILCAKDTIFLLFFCSKFLFFWQCGFSSEPYTWSATIMMGLLAHKVSDIFAGKRQQIHTGHFNFNKQTKILQLSRHAFVTPLDEIAF